MNNEINVRQIIFSICTSAWTPEDAKLVFLWDTLWVGENKKIERGLKAAAIKILPVPRYMGQ